MSSQPPVPLGAVRQALAEVRTPGQAKNVADRADALRHYASRVNDRSLYFQAAELELRAMRTLGEMLVELDLSAGGRPSKTGSKLEPVSATLTEIGIDKKLSMRAQSLARVPQQVFEARLPEAIEQAVSRASRGLNYLFKAVARPAPAAPPPLPQGKYRAILADPPWRFETWSSAGQDRAPENHYPTMDTAAIGALPIDELAADDCALFLWAYAPMLPDALRVIQYWGFQYKTIAFVWVKSNGRVEQAPIGGGYWTRSQAEICLLATRGRPERQAKDVGQLVIGPRGAHSEKPEGVALAIERLVAGPYVELFPGDAGGSRPGWDFWGHPHRAGSAPGEGP